ncbi:MAG: FAD-dependent oxidoreductase [Gemmobacter sp.]|nr:FAD-dependent oxidoreductase [Gemmobacter sp.]
MSDRLDHDVIIAGAGVVGAAIAWHLARAGVRVAIIDATGPAAAASGASDGAVSVASKKPGVMARLASASLIYTHDLAAQGPLQAAFAARPAHIFGSGAAELAAMDTLAAKLNHLSGRVRVVADGGPDLLSGLGTGVDRLMTLEGEGHMPGHKAVRAYLAAPGITCIWPAPLLGYEVADGFVTVRLADRTLRAGQLVLALGVSSPDLIPGLPIVPRAGQLIVTDRGPVGALSGSLTAAAYLVAKTQDGAALPLLPVVIDPLTSGQYLIGSTREDHGDPTRVDFATLRRLLTRAATVWPALRDRRVIRTFAGVRAAVSDSLPIVGPLPGADRVTIVTGFEGDGICLSALIGREVARMLCGLSPDAALAADLAALSPVRFSKNRIEGAA